MPPEQLRNRDVNRFLNHLVIDRRLSASSQNQALNALVLLVKHVLQNVIPQDHLGTLVLLRSKSPDRMPSVLAAKETRPVRG